MFFYVDSAAAMASKTDGAAADLLNMVKIIRLKL